MSRSLTLSDLKIVESLEKYGPRNVTKVAKKMGIPAETLRKRLNRLRSQFFFASHVNIYHTYLGLKKAVIFAEAIPGYEDLLLDCMKTNDFWIFASKCYGTFEGCVGIFTIPIDHCPEFRQFVEEIKKSGIAREIQVYWSTCFHSVNLNCDMLDRKSGTWNFPWDKWIEEIPKKDTKLPYTLEDPTNFPIKGDKIDILILKELEKDGATKFTELAERLGLSPQRIGYRYRKHLIERRLIENFRVNVFHFGRAVSDYYFFIFEFENREKLAKFASSLMDKPFAKTLGKILDESKLYGNIYLPRSEFRRFLNTLSKLARSGFLKGYKYAIQDLEASSRQTISYENFHNGAWIYNQNRYLKEMERLIKRNKKDILEKRLTTPIAA